MKRITIILISTFLFIGLTNLTFNKNMEKEKLKTINKEYEKDNHNESSLLPKQREKAIKTIEYDEQSIAISKSKAIYLVKDMFKNYAYVPSIIEVDHIEGNNYVVHVYEVIKDDEKTCHTATIGWYYVDMYTGKIESIF